MKKNKPKSGFDVIFKTHATIFVGAGAGAVIGYIIFPNFLYLNILGLAFGAVIGSLIGLRIEKKILKK